MDETLDFQETLRQYATNPYFYVALGVVLILVIFFLSRNNNKKKLQKEVEEFQVRLNSLKSVPLPFKVTKALALARVNKDIYETFKTCQENFESVQTNLKKIQEQITDSDEFIQLRKYKMARDNNNETRKLLETTGTTVSNLDKLLNTILEEEEVQRSKITELKEIYHGVKQKINNTPDQYLFCWEALDSKINGIDHLFSEFENIMLANNFEKATEKTEEIRAAINGLNEVVERIPELISVAKGEVPQMVEDVYNSYVLIKNQGAFLDHQEVGKNLNLINDSLQEDLRKIKQCDIEGVNEHLLDCEKRLNQLNSQIEKEKESYGELVSLREVTARNMTQLNNTVEKLSTSYEEMARRYGLQQQNEGLDDASAKARVLNDQCHILMNNIQENKNPASASLINLSQLNTEILVCLNNVNKMSETVRTASADEQSAREQLVKLSIVLSEVQLKIRNNRIPNISTQYDDDVRKAEEYINKLENLLNEQPINVTLVNSLKNSAVELVYQLYESVNRILGTAIMAENAIVIGNMYRSTYSEIDSELTRAELAYRNGEYMQALTIALNTIKKVHPETVEQLINGGKKDNA
ncbi:MAG: hypothetical protein IKE12_06535 [Erysipelotrichaceae bacterium]|nr:hypothetical protein [Erysipelotrichaceae bacterium]